MIGVAKRLIPRSLPPARILRREFSAKAIYSSFPTTLLYYCPRRKSSLYDEKETESRRDDILEDGVKVEENGLVYPCISRNRGTSNGAVLFPNTVMMQELVRGYFNEAVERGVQGRRVDTPYIHIIPKGTTIPSHLILVNEYISRFSLQPSRGMSLRDLNQALDEFYSIHAIQKTVQQWLDSHPFQSAIADDADAKWMLA